MSLKAGKVTERQIGGRRVTTSVRKSVQAAVAVSTPPVLSPGQIAFVCTDPALTIVASMDAANPIVPTGGAGGWGFQDNPSGEQTTAWSGMEGFAVAGRIVLRGADVDAAYARLIRLGIPHVPQSPDPPGATGISAQRVPARLTGSIARIAENAIKAAAAPTAGDDAPDTQPPPAFYAYGNFTGSGLRYRFASRPTEDGQRWIGTTRVLLMLGVSLVRDNPPSLVTVADRAVAS